MFISYVMIGILAISVYVVTRLMKHTMCLPVIVKEDSHSVTLGILNDNVPECVASWVGSRIRKDLISYHGSGHGEIRYILLTIGLYNPPFIAVSTTSPIDKDKLQKSISSFCRQIFVDVKYKEPKSVDIYPLKSLLLKTHNMVS